MRFHQNLLAGVFIVILASTAALGESQTNNARNNNPGEVRNPIPFVSMDASYLQEWWAPEKIEGVDFSAEPIEQGGLNLGFLGNRILEYQRSFADQSKIGSNDKTDVEYIFASLPLGAIFELAPEDRESPELQGGLSSEGAPGNGAIVVDIYYETKTYNSTWTVRNGTLSYLRENDGTRALTEGDGFDQKVQFRDTGLLLGGKNPFGKAGFKMGRRTYERITSVYGRTNTIANAEFKLFYIGADIITKRLPRTSFSQETGLYIKDFSFGTNLLWAPFVSLSKVEYSANVEDGDRSDRYIWYAHGAITPAYRFSLAGAINFDIWATGDYQHIESASDEGGVVGENTIASDFFFQAGVGLNASF